MLNPSCRVTAKASSFVGNDASSLGQGGAVLAAVGATFNGSAVLHSQSTAIARVKAAAFWSMHRKFTFQTL
jgi:hypothetical protein